MGPPEKQIEMLRRWLPGASVESTEDHDCLARVSYENVTVFVPRGWAHDIHQTRLWMRDSGVPSNIKDDLRLGLPSTLAECKELRQRRRQAIKLEAAKWESLRLKEEHDRLAAHNESVSDFFSDLTIKWEFDGNEEWTEESWEHEVSYSMPRFRYTLQWGENTMSFLISHVPEEDRIYVDGRYEDCIIRSLKITEVQGSEPSWDCLDILDYDTLYEETREELAQGGLSGEIFPTWVDTFNLILNPT